jgi:hypothetical protein
MSWKITASYDGLVSDADANTYLAAIQAADGQLLEPGVRIAVNDFIVGCKTDGIWTAIKACGIMAGSRTMEGALVPLVGPNVTNENFLQSDYDRAIGLKGDGLTKRINTNRDHTIDAQNNRHFSVYCTERGTNNAGLLAVRNSNGWSHIYEGSGLSLNFRNTGTLAGYSVASSEGPCFIGCERSLATEYTVRINGTVSTRVDTSTTPVAGDWYLFNLNNAGQFSNARLSFWSIGDSLDLALLEQRVIALMDALAAIII